MKKSLLRGNSKKGFTLIELLIVIAIIAILAVIIVVAINPTSILQKSRDSQRFSDITSLATAVNLYLADSQDFDAMAAGPWTSNNAQTDNARRLNNGTGWITGLNFTTVTTGAPIAALPVDPTNDATNHYTFGIDNTDETYEINCVFESDPENTGKHSADGGDDDTVYEVGTDLTIL